MPSNNIPVLTDRFYPTLATVVNEGKIPEILRLSTDAVSQRFFKKSTRELHLNK